MVFTANHLTVTDKKLNINHKNAHINTIQIKENKQLNIQQKQNYPDPVAFYTVSQEMRWAYSTTAPSTTWGLTLVLCLKYREILLRMWSHKLGAVVLLDKTA